VSGASAVQSQPSQVVVDASLAVKWVLEEDLTAEARAVLLGWQSRETRRIVPSWFCCEVANVLYKRVRKNTLSVLDAQIAVEALLQDVMEHDVEPEVSKRALEIAYQLGNPASYDAHYVALAERLGCEIWTADERFWNASGAAFSFLKWIGNIVPPDATVK
jgi:predicted nucleic acid-binding protein